MTDELSPRSFYAERVPAQFNRSLVEQKRAAEKEQRVLEGMQSVNATIRVDVGGDDGGTFFLNVNEGKMTAGDAADHQPFLTMIQERDSFERIVEEAGDSALGLLAGLSGLAGEMRLTAQRIENLAGVKGCVRFEVAGESGFAMLTHIGPDPLPDAPDCTIRFDEQGYRDLRAGAIEPQQALMSGVIKVEGDMQLAMQLALAAMSPD